MVKFFLRALVLVACFLPTLAFAEVGVQSCFTPREQCVDDVVSLIGKARSKILVFAYQFTEPSIADALIKASASGVSVSVLLDGPSAKQKWSQAPRLKAAKILVYADSKHRIMHSKVVVVDDVTVLTGSYNFTSSAEKKNQENFVILTGYPDLVSMYQIDFAFHKKHSILM